MLEGDPVPVMSSYNIINGHRASENKDLLTGILREEWGFDGMVTTDWWTFGEHYKETAAGNDMKMGYRIPGQAAGSNGKGRIDPGRDGESSEEHSAADSQD